MLHNPLTVTDSNGKVVYVGWYRPVGSNGSLVNEKLLPGKEVEYDKLELQLSPVSAKGDQESNMTLFGAGKFQFQYMAGGSTTAGKMSNTTGKLELEVNPEKEPFTAWGKEVGGLQAGLGYPLGAKRVYSHGEKVKFVLRVRNLGKEEVEFKHIWAFFVENPPAIMDADGKPVQLPRYSASGEHGPRSPKIAPGKEVDLYEWKFDLRPKGESSKPNSAVPGSGRFSVQCERIVGPTSANSQDPNPALSKLATGKLDLKVKEPIPTLPQLNMPAEEPATALPPKKEPPLHRLGQGSRRSASGLGFQGGRETSLQPRREGQARRSGSQRRQGGGQVPVPPPILC